MTCNTAVPSLESQVCPALFWIADFLPRKKANHTNNKKTLLKDQVAGKGRRAGRLEICSRAV